MKISGPEKTTVGSKVRVRFAIDSDVATDTHELWYELDADYRGFLSDSADSALIALLLPAMYYGESIEVEGEVSSELIRSIRQDIQYLYKILNPDFQYVDVRCSRFSTEASGGSAIATGCSAGVDSLCTIAENFLSDIPEDEKVDLLLFNNVGSHGIRGRELFLERLAHVQPLASELGLPLVSVDSNVSDFYSDTELGFMRTHTLRNASVALLLQRKIGQFLYASSYAFPQIRVAAKCSSGYVDAIVLPLISNRNIRLRSSEAALSRVEKTMRIAQMKLAQGKLDVCAGGAKAVVGNCSECWKCMRTMLTLDVAGALEKFSAVFDLNKYFENRAAYQAEVLNSDDPHLQEIVSFAVDSNYRFSRAARLRSTLRLPIRAAKWVFRPGTPG